MSFDKYVQHISQKYRLAVAISVIKTKPENLSIEEFLTQLQNKIRDMETDPNETVCSDDFNFDDDDIWNEKQDNTQIDSRNILNENRLDCLENNNESQGSQTILNDFVFGDGQLECNPQRSGNSLGDTIRLLKEVSTNVHEQLDGEFVSSQLTFCESQETNINDDVTNCYNFPDNATNDNNKYPQNNENNNIDSQETQLYTPHGFTQCYTHVSQSQNEYFVISDKYIRNNANNDNVQDNFKENNDINGPNDDEIQRFNVSQNVLTQNVLTMNVEERDSIRRETNEPETTITVENTFGNAHYQFHPQSGAGSRDDIANVTKNAVTEIDNRNVYNESTFHGDINNASATNKSNVIETFIVKGIKDTDGVRNKSGTNATDVNTNSTPIISFDSQNSHNEFTANSNKMRNIEQNSITCKDSETNENTQNNFNSDNVQQEIDNIIEIDMELDETESDENVHERVPFKVIEELNRVKTFINKKEKKYDGYSTDSGYRSDSQLRGSLKSCSQLSQSWVNQSAHCLFNHIMQATTTDDIIKEIAQALGKLIDKLQDEENYPSFLEEILETVDSMLRDIHSGDGWACHLLLTKDEKVQRLILINKSKHILKYSIEKITAILEQLYTNLTQENLYECTNIVDLENVSYIFHILEIFLKRYKKVNVSNQNTQNSQEDTLPRRSSLTELWRKKWNPNIKEIVRSENKTCVLKGCSDILNKIIVKCMNGYSLVSFAALQCFNSIQD